MQHGKQKFIFITTNKTDSGRERAKERQGERVRGKKLKYTNINNVRIGYKITRAQK